jgi:hypothetical protein
VAGPALPPVGLVPGDGSGVPDVDPVHATTDAATTASTAPRRAAPHARCRIMSPDPLPS